MSVLVKDMKMPKYCLECPFEDSPEFESYCIAIGNEFIGKWEDLGSYKPDWCPLQDALMVGEWIPVSERMPSVDGDAYLVTDYCTQINHRRTRIAYCYANKDGFWSNTPKGYEIVAWMPLPEPYKGGDSDG